MDRIMGRSSRWLPQWKANLSGAWKGEGREPEGLRRVEVRLFESGKVEVWIGVWIMPSLPTP